MSKRHRPTRTPPVRITATNVVQVAAALGRYLEAHLGDEWHERLAYAAQQLQEPEDA